jgi:hypothetical protein
MISSASHTTAFRALAVVAALALGSIAEAQIQFQVKLNTSSLIGNPAGPYSLDFQLNDGSGWGDGNNIASISDFQFGGGSATGWGTATGGAMGNLASTITLNDTNSLLNEFYQGFTAGSWLSFTVSLSTQVDAGPTPDRFSFAILDNSLMNLATQSLGTDTFIEVDINSGNPTVFAFGSADQTIGAPTVTPVPEASTYGLAGVALLGLVALKRRKQA